jgi:RNA polymerase sigma-70 factor, ECF subfamily
MGTSEDDELSAFEQAYDMHARGLFAVAYGVLGDVAQAQDVVQDVFLGLWREPGRFDARRGSLSHYLRMVARSRALDLWRETQVAARARERLRALVRVDEAPLEAQPAAAVERRAASASVRRALLRLPGVQREALVLAYWGGFTADEIARGADVPVGTVKSRIRLGLMKLREQCEPDLAGARLAA